MQIINGGLFDIAQQLEGMLIIIEKYNNQEYNIIYRKLFGARHQVLICREKALGLSGIKRDPNQKPEGL